MSFKVKFWGVRGSIPTPSPKHMRYGGNTSCIELGIGGQRVILDAGTGIRNLGHWLQRKESQRTHLLFSHTHLDHITGFPFFSPAFHSNRSLIIMAGHLSDTGGIRQVLSGQMTEPTFPVPMDSMGAAMEFADFRAGDHFMLSPEIAVRTAPLNHPNGATAYRIESGGRSVCYVTDTEHVSGQPDQNVLGLIEGADMVIYDSTYTDAEFPGKIGWGHSTWQEGARLCKLAKVKTFVIFHHDPDHDDEVMSRIEQEAKSLSPGCVVAREGLRLSL